MRHGFESFESKQESDDSFVEKKTWPNGAKVVELHTKTNTITCMLRNGEPFITSSTGPMNFKMLSPHDQQLVIDALLE